jgi:8-oxo-dGTP pyrophosphatase MutT (NUDIX family)
MVSVSCAEERFVPDKSWTLLGSRPVSEHRIFRLRYDLYRVEPSGSERDFVVMEAPNWVNVVPITSDGQVVLVRQFRHGIRRTSLEVPGGMIDPGETPEQAGLRELREETGYVAERIRLLGRVAPNPAIQDNWCYFFLAEGCRPDGQPQPDEFERIEVVLRTLDEIPDLLRREEICHGLVINALGFLGLTRIGDVR